MTKQMVFVKKDGKWLRASRPIAAKSVDVANSPKVREFKARMAVEGRKVKVVQVPSNTSLNRWAMNEAFKTPDGCEVEPDGECPHGWASWGVYLGW